MNGDRVASCVKKLKSFILRSVNFRSRVIPFFVDIEIVRIRQSSKEIHDSLLHIHVGNARP